MGKLKSNTTGHDEQSQPSVDTVYMWVLAACSIWPLRVITPLLWAFLLQSLFARCLRRSTSSSLCTLTLHDAALVWAVIECGFHIRFMRSLRRLQRRHTPPVMSKQRRQALFERVATESGGPPYDFLLRWFPGACTLTDVACQTSGFGQRGLSLASD